MRLHSRTLAKRIEWAIEDGSHVRAMLGGFVVTLGESPSNMDPETPDYRITVWTDSGVVLDQFVDTDLAEFADEEFNAYRLLRETYVTARRQALGADVALDSIMDALGDD